MTPEQIAAIAAQSECYLNSDTSAIRALLDHISALERERDEARDDFERVCSELEAHEEDEARLCPEDQSWQETLRAARRERDEARAALESIPTWGSYRWDEVAATVKAKMSETARQLVDTVAELREARVALAAARREPGEWLRAKATEQRMSIGTYHTTSVLVEAARCWDAEHPEEGR